MKTMKYRFLITLIETVEVTETIAFLIETDAQKDKKQPMATESGTEAADSDGNASQEVANTSQIDSKNDPLIST